MSVEPSSATLAARAFEALVTRARRALLVLTDDRLRILRAGDEAAALTDRSASELPGLSLIAAFGSAALEGVARRALAEGSAAVGEAELGIGGGRSFAVEAVPLPGGLVLALHEETAVRRLERMRRDFVANLGHELRTPLASIKLIAETLAAGIDDPATAREFALQIEREIDHLAQLVDELRDLSTIESGELQLTIEAVDPAELLAGVVERIGPVAERRGVRVRQLPDPAEGGGLRVRADQVRLGQALLNLAHNAVKFSHPDGEVRVGWEPAGAQVRLTVADDGIGIPDAQLDRIFERFYKVDRSRARDAADAGLGGGSAGLGLAIVRHIAQAHGGQVGVSSREGAGSLFWLEVPSA